MFFDGHERKNVIKYRETFLDEIKSLLLYFVEFLKDGAMVLIEYLSNCQVGRLEKIPIIMITYDKSTFSTNDSCKKVWTFNSQGVL